MKKIIAIIFSSVALWAALKSEGDYGVDQYIMESLDLPPQFLQSEMFQKTYERYKRLRDRSFIDTKSVVSYFIPNMQKILEARGVPEIFLFMAMAESNFRSHAKSSKSAVGIWQFIPQTARKYGLRIDEFVDERKDPIKATQAAVRYLKFLYKMFGKWSLVAIAYNCGEGRLLQAMKQAGSKDLMVLLDEEKKYLPKESRRYLYKIAALAKLSYDFSSKMSHELNYLFVRDEDYTIVPVKVRGAETLAYIADRIRLGEEFLAGLNPQLKRGFTPPREDGYHIYIPQVKYEDFKRYYKPSHGYENFVVYRVKSGDSLYAIARRFKTSIKAIKSINKMRSSLLRVGQKVIIPVPKKRKKLYRVRKGDTILKIAKRFGVDPIKLKEWNRKKSNLLKVGEELVVLQ